MPFYARKGASVNLNELYHQNRLILSFELFPPQTNTGMENLKENLGELLKLNPSFITCTYGAGGSTRQRTLEVLAGVKQAHPSMPLATHLTCVGSTADELRAYLRQAQEMGVNYVVALRGDPPAGDSTFKPVTGGLSHANELVSLIHADFPDFGILVAGYPEVHQEALSPSSDLENLKRKVDAGADAILTQLFFQNEDFFRWRERCEAVGIKVPITPGIFPVINFKQIQRITSLCGAKLPHTLIARMEKHQDDPDGQLAVGIHYSTRQIEELIEAGVPGIHFYVLNKAQATAQICRALCLGMD